MNDAGLIGSDEERAGRQLAIQAEIIVNGRRGDIPPGFVPLLFGRAAAEDLVRYDSRELAALAEAAWSLLGERKPGTTHIRIENRTDVADSHQIGRVTIIEIVNDDMPFLLDSVLGELTEQGVEVRLVVHPIVNVERGDDGTLVAFRGDRHVAEGKRESFIHIHVDRIDAPAKREVLMQALEQTLRDVRLAVQDWQAMRTRVQTQIAAVKENPPPLPIEETAEAIQFLEWLTNNNFTFLGIREYEFKEGEQEVDPQFESGLGILRQRDVRVLRRGNELVTITPEVREFLAEPKALIITKANVRSRVHRRVHMDYIGVKRFDSEGAVIGEFRIVGLFTSNTYTRSARSVPYLRRKLDAVQRRAGFDENSHSGKALANVLESYPRDDLFQIDEETLYEFAIAIMQLEERPRVRVLARRDRFDRFVSVLVYIPRERFGSGVRIAIGEFLARVYKGRVSAFYPFFPEGPLVRVHFIIGRWEGETPNPPRSLLEDEVAAIVRTWSDRLESVVALVYDTDRAQTVLARYRSAFSAGYQEAHSAETAVGDIRVIENLTSEKPVGIEFYRRTGEPSTSPSASLKVWSAGRPIPLSERVPVLENMGFKVVDERTFRIDPAGGETREIWLHDMLLERDDGGAIDLDALAQRLQAAFLAVIGGEAENDGFNALVLAAGLPWRDIALLRTIARFLRQARIAYSQDYLWTTLRKHAGIAERVNALFHVKFDPKLEISQDERGAREAKIIAEIEAALSDVASLDEDVILRRFVNAVQAAVRTNFFQSGKATISIKFESRKVEGLPAPRPLFEIFVYSPRMEGGHLRFGKVARGGIRWSDRPQDFRTEVLGLVKAQQVKNAVIVPVGAKGGFVPKRLVLGAPREAVQAEGIATYKLLVSSLLDITDNLGPDGVIPPANVVRHDADDPYLVVAADKGTATFSDIANGISGEHGFWLGDAFASGGSAGYDHKGMGITARGAWEAVKRHFREMDVDITTQPFSVVGVGDMSGDVFGNGMLRERTTRLVAAFDHRDIFIDPEPNPERSFDERARLFALPRSSWQDYDKKLISPGGGVFPRAAKEIQLSEPAQKMLGLERAKATPTEVMRAILRMNVDLLWFGGIGTYVRASSEGDDAAGDRANDAIRATGAELNVKVIGEGANLGMTQRGRIEAATRGIRLNTDAIDNSAGVNTSDVEVNIKIALATPVRDGKFTLEGRNKLLAEMTDEVGELVLRNNYLQTLALSLTERRGVEDLGFQQRLMQTLEARGLLDRKLEFLPDDMEIGERRKRNQALTRPELSVLLAYAKLTLYSDLLDSAVPDDPYLARELGRYFPKRLSEQYPEALATHRLRREIIATHLANSMINRGGPSLLVRIADQTGASPDRIAAAFAAVRDSYRMTALNTEIDALDNKVSGAVQLGLYAAVQDLLLDRLVWFLRNVDLTQRLAGIVEHYGAGISEVETLLDDALSSAARAERDAKAAALVAEGVPQGLATQIASLRALSAAPDIVLVADRAKKSIAEVTATYFAAGSFFGLDRIREPARAIAVSDYFDRLALDRALDSIAEAERRLTAEMVGNGAAGAAAVEAWVKPRAAEVERIRAAVNDIAGSALTISKLSVAASLVGDLVKH